MGHVEVEDEVGFKGLGESSLSVRQVGFVIGLDSAEGSLPDDGHFAGELHPQVQGSEVYCDVVRVFPQGSTHC